MCIYCPGIHFYFMSVFLFDKYTFKLNCILRISCLGPPPSSSRDKKTFITSSVLKGHRTLLQSSNRCNFSLEAKNPEAKSPPERHHKHQGGGGRVIQNSKSRYPVIVRFHSSRFYASRCLYTSVRVPKHRQRSGLLHGASWSCCTNAYGGYWSKCDVAEWIVDRDRHIGTEACTGGTINRFDHRTETTDGLYRVRS